MSELKSNSDQNTFFGLYFQDLNMNKKMHVHVYISTFYFLKRPNVTTNKSLSDQDCLLIHAIVAGGDRVPPFSILRCEEFLSRKPEEIRLCMHFRN